jgi:hypothetical protein
MTPEEIEAERAKRAEWVANLKAKASALYVAQRDGPPKRPVGRPRALPDPHAAATARQPSYRRDEPTERLTERVLLSLSGNMHAQLQDIARRHERSVSSTIRHAIDTWLKSPCDPW